MKDSRAWPLAVCGTFGGWFLLAGIWMLVEGKDGAAEVVSVAAALLALAALVLTYDTRNP